MFGLSVTFERSSRAGRIVTFTPTRSSDNTRTHGLDDGATQIKEIPIRDVPRGSIAQLERAPETRVLTEREFAPYTQKLIVMDVVGDLIGKA